MRQLRQHEIMKDQVFENMIAAGRLGAKTQILGLAE